LLTSRLEKRKASNVETSRVPNATLGQTMASCIGQPIVAYRVVVNHALGKDQRKITTLYAEGGESAVK